MPIYEYRCEKCGDFEHTQRITDAPLQRCPTCKRKVRRLISNTSFQLKGSGWYVTDYARAKREGGGAKSESEGGEKAGEKTDKSDKTEKAGHSEKVSKSEKPSGKSDKKKT